MRTWGLVVLFLMCIAGFSDSKILRANAKQLTNNIFKFAPQRTVLERDGKKIEVEGGIDFNGAELDPETGKFCVYKEMEVEALDKKPVLQCTHSEVEKCHFTYVTEFVPSKEEVCDENFQKQCQISFRQQENIFASNETIQNCITPVEKSCNGEGPEECRTVYESSCSTKFIQAQTGGLLADTKCEKLPIEICGKGCVYKNAPQVCRDEVVTSIVEVPIEVCDLNPQKICRFATKMSPRLTPKEECTLVPKESCIMSFTKAKPTTKTILSKWCLDNPEEDLNLPAVADPRMLQIDEDEATSNRLSNYNPQPEIKLPTYSPQAANLPSYSPEAANYPSYSPEAASLPSYSPQAVNRLPNYKSKVEIIPTEAPKDVTATDTIIVDDNTAVTDFPDFEKLTEQTTTPIQLEYSTLLPPHGENNNHILFDFSAAENEIETGTEAPPLRTYGVPKTYHHPSPAQPLPLTHSNSFQSTANNLASYDYPKEQEEPKSAQFEVDLSRVNFPSQPILASGVQPPSVRVREQDRHQSFRGGISLHDDLFPPPPPPGSPDTQRFARQQKSHHSKRPQVYDDNIIFVKVTAPGEEKVSGGSEGGEGGVDGDKQGRRQVAGYQLDYYSANSLHI